MTRRRRLFVIAVLVVLVVVPGTLLVSETALRAVVAFAARQLPGLEVDDVRGRLLTGVSADRVFWRGAGGVKVTVTDFASRWRAWHALSGRLHLQTLAASKVAVTLPARDPDAAERPRSPWRLPDFELPIVLRVGALAVDRVTVSRGGTMLIDAHAVSATDLYGDPRLLSAGRVSASGAPLSLAAAISVQPRGDWPISVSGNGTLALDGRPPIMAGIEADGALASELDVVVRARSDGGLVFEGRVSRLLDSPRVRGKLALDDVAVEPWVAALPGARVAGAFELDGGYENLLVNGAGTVRMPDWPDAAVELDLSWGSRLLGIRRLQISGDGIEGPVTVVGHLDWTGAAPSGAARVSWQGLNWPPGDHDGPWRSAQGTATVEFRAKRADVTVDAQLGASPDGRVIADGDIEWQEGASPTIRLTADWTDLALFNLESGQGELAAQGTLDEWRGSVTTTLTPPAVGPLAITLQARGGRSRLVASGLQVRGLGGTAIGDGTVSWSDGVRADVQLRATGMDLARLPPGWPGSLDGTLDASIVGTHWAVALSDGEGRIRDRPLRADAEVAGVAGTIERVAATLDVGDSHAEIAGRWAPDLDLTWRIDAPDVAALLPGAAGRLQANGALRGDATAPALAFDVDGADLAYAGYAAGRVRGRGEIDLGAGAGAADAELLIERAEAGGRTFDRTHARVGGTRDALTIRVDADALGSHAVFALAGAWRDRGFAGRVQEATLTNPDEPPWVINRAARFDANAERITLAPVCWRQRETTNEVCGELSWVTDESLVANASLTGLPLQDLSRWLPTGFQYSGRLSGNAELEWAAGEAPTARGELAVSAGQWRQFVRGEPVALLNWESARVRGRIDASTLHATAGFSLVEGGNLDAELRLPLFDTAEGAAEARPFRTHVAGQFSDLDLLPAFIPDIGTVSGRVRADLLVTGTLSDPVFDGSLAIEDGVTTIPRLGLSLTDLGLALQGTRAGLGLRGTVTSGDGHLEFDGQFDITDGRLSGTSRLTGQSFRAMNMPEFQVDVSPDIGIEIAGHSVAVEGEVRIPSARISPRDFEGQVTVSADEILVDEPVDEEANPWRISSRVRIVLGDVSFDGFGLTGDVTGSLTAVDEPDRPTRGTGELSITDGRYQAWGQQLDIEFGRLLFAGGPLTHPGLSVRAVREIQDVTVGVDVRGTLREPELHLFSDPPMPQAELMSWLVLGSPLNQATGAEQQLLDRTRNTAGLAGGEMVARELGRRLGLSDVAIDRGTTPDEAALVIGHYLSPRLYIGYGIGLFDPANSIRLRYHLHRNWTIEAETGPRADSTDLLWTIER
ncbi:MAG: translocation/assembly module TamB domain-containing protein [Gammaproteobacteria bacterium]